MHLRCEILVIPASAERHEGHVKGICSDVPLSGPATELNVHDGTYDIGRCYVAECHQHCLTVVVVVVAAASKGLMQHS